MPVELVDARGNALEHIARGEIDEPLEKIKAHPAHARFVHPSQFVVTDLLADKRNAFGAPARRFERIDHSDCPWNGTRPGRSRSCRGRGSRAARTAFPSAHRTACICARARTEIWPRGRTRGSVHQPRP